MHSVFAFYAHFTHLRQEGATWMNFWKSNFVIILSIHRGVGITSVYYFVSQLKQ